MSAFKPKPDYLKHATGFEKAQLRHMAKIIEAKAAELRDLRYERGLMADRIKKRGRAKTDAREAVLLHDRRVEARDRPL